MQNAANFIRGSVRLEAVGPYPERFFNILSARGIRFWQAEQLDAATVRLTVARSQAGRAQALGKWCLCEVRRVETRGAAAFLMGFRARYGLLIGMALSLLAVLVLSRFVLVIDITGSTSVPEGVILSELRAAGLELGSYGPAVDERAVSNRMLLAEERLGFLSVNIRGIRAEVVVRDAELPPETEPVGQARDLTAAKAGRVVRVLPVAGQVLIQPEDEVTAGQTLISGTVAVNAGPEDETPMGSYAVRAKGEVWAEVEEQLSAAAPLSGAEKRYSGRVRRELEVNVLGQSFKISPKLFQPFTYYDKIESNWELSLSERLTLPFALTARTWREYMPEEGMPDRQSAQTQVQSALTERLEHAVGPGGQVLAQTWSTQERDGVLTVTLTARCLEQIAQSDTRD
mgnify:CR=1 FL=1